MRSGGAEHYEVVALRSVALAKLLKVLFLIVEGYGELLADLRQERCARGFRNMHEVIRSARLKAQEERGRVVLCGP